MDASTIGQGRTRSREAVSSRVCDETDGCRRSHFPSRRRYQKRTSAVMASDQTMGCDVLILILNAIYHQFPGAALPGITEVTAAACVFA